MKHRKVRSFFSVFAALLCCMALSASVVYADTDGTELQVEQPMTLELQLGPEWAGVEFQLKTDTGTYPGVIVVGDDGILRTELGGSMNYTLSCLSSSIAAPSPDDTQTPATTEPDTGTVVPEETPAADEDAPADNPDNPDAEAVELAGEGEASISGIPVGHIILFGGGMLLAVGSLIAIRIVKKRSTSSNRRDDDEYDDEDN